MLEVWENLFDLFNGRKKKLLVISTDWRPHVKTAHMLQTKRKKNALEKFFKLSDRKFFR